MIIDTERLVHASSISSGNGVVKIELDEIFPEIDQIWGKKVIFAVKFGDSLVIVIGTLADYEELEPDPDSFEPEAFARLSVNGQSISISI